MTNNELTSLAHYRIVRKLGRGSFAEVYLAEDTRLGREVALKILHPQLLTDPDFVRQFENDARAAARLDHPHIVTVYDIGQAEGRLFIPMQYCTGGSLSARLQCEGSLCFDEAVRIIAQIADALDYAHQSGFIHRDIKPSNILFDAQGRAVLGDFGLVTSAEDSVIARSTTGGIVGTPAYIAPEIWDDEPATPATDVYALGCVLYEMLTGEALFGRSTTLAVMKAHASSRQFPKTMPDGVPSGIIMVLERALARKITQRYSSAGTFASVLVGLKNGEEQRSHKVAGWLRVVAALVILILGLWLVGTLWFGSDELAQSLDPAEVAVTTAEPSLVVYSTIVSTRTPILRPSESATQTPAVPPRPTQLQPPTRTSIPQPTDPVIAAETLVLPTESGLGVNMTEAAVTEATKRALPTQQPSIADSDTASTPLTSSYATDVSVGTGTGEVTGRVLWNEIPWPNVSLELTIGGRQKVASVRSDEAGVFYIRELPAGQYALSARHDHTAGASLGQAVPQPVVGEGQTINIGDYHVVRMDLRLLSPAVNETVTQRRPTFVWQPYESAVSYRVHIRPQSDHDLVQNYEGLETTSLTPNRDLYPGVYSWSVQAYNASGVEIAKTTLGVSFTVNY